MNTSIKPRAIHYIRELDKIADLLAEVLDGLEIDDDRVRTILLFNHFPKGKPTTLETSSIHSPE